MFTPKYFAINISSIVSSSTVHYTLYWAFVRIYGLVTDNFIRISLQNSVTMFKSLFIPPSGVLDNNNKLSAKNNAISVVCPKSIPKLVS